MRAALITAAATIIAALIAAYVELSKQTPPAVLPTAAQTVVVSVTAHAPTDTPVPDPLAQDEPSIPEAGQYFLLSSRGLQVFEIGRGDLILRQEGSERFEFTIQLWPKSKDRPAAAATGKLFHTADRWIMNTETSTERFDFIDYGAFPVSVTAQGDILTLQSGSWTMEWAKG